VICVCKIYILYLFYLFATNIFTEDCTHKKVEYAAIDCKTSEVISAQRSENHVYCVQDPVAVKL